MAVDWRIHVIEPPVDDNALKCFFHNHAGHELEDFEYQCPQAPAIGSCQHSWDIAQSQAVEVGSKHWLEPWWRGKAPEDLDDPITNIIYAFDDFSVVTPELVETIRSHYELPSTRMFPMPDIEQYRERTLDFLNRNMGKRIFAVGW